MNDEKKIETMTTNIDKARDEAICKVCHRPAAVIVGGMYSTVAPKLRLCADCINKLIKNA